MNEKPPVVLSHGLWLTPLSWENCVERYRARGHAMLAWPGLDRDPAEAGVAIDSALEHASAAA